MSGNPSDGPSDPAALARELGELREEHRSLDDTIARLEGEGRSDLLRLQRLKKRKLQLRDRIAWLEDNLTPDIIA